MSFINSLSTKTIIKGVVSVFLATYILLPVFLYFFTPVGAVVFEVVRQVSGKYGLFEGSVSNGAVKSDLSLVNPVPTPAREMPYTILLMGYGGGGHDGPLLTDTMILAIVDPKSKSLSMISIPRDTLVNLPLNESDGIWSKINTAYAYGQYQNIYTERPERYKNPRSGGLLAKDTVEVVLGIPVRHYMALDFNTFRKLIDEVGGIDITVQAAFSSNYPKEDNPAIDPGWKVISFAAGLQHMSGERALQYARAREPIENSAEGSDFARSQRQRQIMQAFADKVISPAGLVHIPGLLAIMKTGIDTDIAVPSMGETYQMVTDWRGLKITSIALTSDNYLTSDGSNEKGYFLNPVAGQNDWSQLHTLINILIDDPSLAAKMATTKVVIRNGSGVPDAGKDIRNRLMSQGFVIAPVETVSLQNTTHIEDMTRGESSNVIDALMTALGNSEIPIQTGKNYSRTVIIVLGQDELP